jgi:signal transduction histidine kinase
MSQDVARRMLVGEIGATDMEKRYLRRDGQAVWTSVRVVLIKGEDFQPLHFITHIIEITHRKRAEEEIRRLHSSLTAHAEELEQRVIDRTAELAVALDRAEASDRTKSVFLAIMSHELRTPLNSIIGFTSFLLKGLVGPLNAEQAKQLGMIKGSGQHLLALINDILDISKIEADRIEINNKPFDLREAIQKVIADVMPLADNKELSLVTRLAPEVGQITSDRRRIEQVLLNLLGNAIKFTEQGQITLVAEALPTAIRISITDTGIGIQPEDLGKLFQPFSQINTGSTRQHEGTGLGLAICSRLVKLLGGETRVESEWGKGSRFSVTLPIQPEWKL